MQSQIAQRLLKNGLQLLRPILQLLPSPNRRSDTNVNTDALEAAIPLGLAVTERGLDIERLVEARRRLDGALSAVREQMRQTLDEVKEDVRSMLADIEAVPFGERTEREYRLQAQLLHIETLLTRLPAWVWNS